jgi:organic radical activating enzyme
MGAPKPLERIHLEVTNVCNFKCEFCPDAIMMRKRGHMDWKLLETTLHEIAQKQLAHIVAFHLMGEPLIYPQIFAAIDLAVALKLKLHLTTNGSTFALKRDHIDQLIATGLPKVTISLQTPDPLTFTIRGAPPALQPESYFEGITQFVQANLANPHSTTRVHLKILDTTAHPFLVPHKPLHVVEGKAQMQQQLTHWAKKLLLNTSKSIRDQEIQEQEIQDRIQQYKPGRWQVIELTPKLALETFPLDSWGNVGLDQAQLQTAQFGYCNGASAQAGILYDGTVVPCCKDYEGRIPLGNLHEQSLETILQGASACSLRQGFDRYQVTHPVCQQCMGADSPAKALLRQVGSVAYFKLYGPLMKQLQPGWGEI